MKNDPILKCVTRFCRMHWDKKSPLLLGLSGGPDSKALLYALLETGCHSLQVAHVDHGWREESHKEREELQKEVERLKIPFHFMRLQNVPSRNKEASAREERLQFFRKVAEDGFQALLLAHQAEDLAETVFKRVLEGAHLPFLGSMQEVSPQKEGPPIWRPFLSMRRKTILAFLEKRAIAFFQDPTNLDPSYLRGRLRSSLFPELQKNFGKEFIGNLLLLSKRSFDLQEYLDRRVDRVPTQWEERGCSAFLAKLDPFEARHWVQKKAKEMNIPLSRDLLQQILASLFSKQGKKFFAPYFFVDRGHLSIHK